MKISKLLSKIPKMSRQSREKNVKCILTYIKNEHKRKMNTSIWKLRFWGFQNWYCFQELIKYKANNKQNKKGGEYSISVLNFSQGKKKAATMLVSYWFKYRRYRHFYAICNFRGSFERRIESAIRIWHWIQDLMNISGQYHHSK